MSIQIVRLVQCDASMCPPGGHTLLDADDLNIAPLLEAEGWAVITDGDVIHTYCPFHKPIAEALAERGTVLAEAMQEVAP